MAKIFRSATVLGSDAGTVVGKTTGNPIGDATASTSGSASPLQSVLQHISMSTDLNPGAPSTSTQSSALTTTAGSLLMAAIAMGPTQVAVTPTVTSVTDTASNAWAKLFGTSGFANPNLTAIEVWATTAASPAAISAGHITMSFSDTCGAVAVVWEVSGVLNVSPLDVHTTATVNGSMSMNSGSSGTPATGNELFFGASTIGLPATTWSNATFTFVGPAGVVTDATHLLHTLAGPPDCSIGAIWATVGPPAAQILTGTFGSSKHLDLIWALKVG